MARVKPVGYHMCLDCVTPRSIHLLVLAITILTVSAPAAAKNAATATAATTTVTTSPGSYGLDQIARVIPERGRVRCPKVKLVRYTGSAVRYASRITVYEGFRERLRRFERIVRATAKEVYGRAPWRIRHWGGYTCRRMSTERTFLSEHALGNAIDVYGFDFSWVNPRQGKKLGIPPTLRRPFRITVKKHWRADKGVDKIHARFLRLVFKRLVAQRNVFTVLLGPGYPGHDDHFHFDVAPWRLVSIDM